MASIDYKPSPTCEEFIRDFLPGELFYNFIVGPYGSGKTSAVLFKLAFMASLQEPSKVDGIRRTRAVVVRNTGNQLNDTTIPSWNIWFKDGIAGHWKATTKTFILRFADVECEVLFRPLDTPDDVSRVLSLEVTFAILDEFVEIPKEIVEALSGRCGRYPSMVEGAGATNWGMWGASNPGQEDSWWHTFLGVDNEELRPENVAYYHQPSGLSPEAENLDHLPGGRGYYENLRKGKSDAWVKQFIDAEWGYTVSGKPVIPTFQRDIHVAKSSLIFNPHLPLVIGYDPGVRHSALIFGQEDHYGRLNVLNELILAGYGATRMADDRLLPMLRMKYRGAETIIAPDPAANARSANNESTIVATLRSMKYRKHWSVDVDDTNLLAPRLEAIEHFTTRLTEKGPALQIDPQCKALIRALSGGWRYENTKANAEKPTPEKDIHSHPGDGLSYLCRYFHRATVRRGRRTAANARPVLPTFTNTYVMR